MLRLNCKITAGKITVRFAEKVRIDSSWATVGDSAMFTIPNKVRDQEGNVREVYAEEKLIENGDKVKIELGYFPELKTEFEGYVTHVEPDFPLKVHCEDLNFILKQENINDEFEDVTLGDLMERISPVDYRVNVESTTSLGTLRVKNVTVTRLLQDKIKSTYGIHSFVRDGKLEVGVPYPGDTQTVHKFAFGKNIVSDSLRWRSKEALKWRVQGKSPQEDGSLIKAEVGDNSGSVRTLFKYNVDKKTLEEAAQRYYERLDFTGWSGSFTTFGRPFVRHGDAVEVKNERLPEREGIYNVKRVETHFGTGGFRRVIEPDNIVP
jgi:hypothetical protein